MKKIFGQNGFTAQAFLAKTQSDQTDLSIKHNWILLLFEVDDTCNERKKNVLDFKFLKKISSLPSSKKFNAFWYVLSLWSKSHNCVFKAYWCGSNGVVEKSIKNQFLTAPTFIKVF